MTNSMREELRIAEQLALKCRYAISENHGKMESTDINVEQPEFDGILELKAIAEKIGGKDISIMPRVLYSNPISQDKEIMYPAIVFPDINITLQYIPESDDYIIYIGKPLIIRRYNGIYKRYE